MRLIDADAMIEYLHEFRCKDCERRKGMKNGKSVFCYEIGDAPCRACDIGDAIDLLDEYISPMIDAVQVVRCKECRYGQYCTDEKTIYQCFKCNSNEFGAFHEQDWYCADGERED